MTIVLLAGSILFIALMTYVAYLIHEKFGDQIKTLLDILVLTRVSAMVVVFGAFILVLNDQGRDLAVGLSDHVSKGIAFLLAVGLWAVQSWYWARMLVDREYGATDQYRGLKKFLIQHIPRMIGLLAFGLAIKALAEVPSNPINTIYLIICSAMAVAFYALVWYRRELQKRLSRMLNSSFDVFERRLKTVMQTVSAAVIVIFSVWAFAAPVSMGFRLGAGAVFFIAMASMVPVGTAMVAITYRYRFPVVTSLVLIGLAFSCFNDNHAIRSLPSTAKQFGAAQAFDNWLQQDTAAERQVVVVATAGGGIRAAYWTATVLGAAQDRVPAFRERLFAASGVSGGSVGATVFTTLLAQDPALCAGRADCYQSLGQQVLGGDFLAPTITAMLYPDFIQRLLPVALLPDRAQALEKSWEKRWNRVLPGGGFGLGGGLTQMYGGSGWLPLLLLNSTHEETGNRIVTSPMEIEQSMFAGTIDFYKAHPCEVRASTAAHSSARFSYVSPAGRISAGECDATAQFANLRETHLVDGGYFENYGAATAHDLLRWMTAQAAKRQIKLKPVVIQISNDVEIPVDILHKNYEPVAEPQRFANETRAPLTTIFNTRTARGEMEFINLYRWTRSYGRDACFFHFRFYKDPGHEPALGWVLSDASQQWIREHLVHQNKKVYDDLIATLQAGSCS